MKSKVGLIAPQRNILWITLMVSCLLLMAGCHSNKSEETATTPVNPSTSPSTPNSSDLQKQHEKAERKFRPEIETQRQRNQKEAEQNLSPEAIDAVQQTEQAIQAIAANKKDTAMAAIERATGKINILLARNPASALIPVGVQVVVLDTAPLDVKTIDQLVQQATTAVKAKDLPTARVLLAALVSELRIRTTDLPLATYPAALSQAARFLDQGKNQEAGTVLLTALNTLVIVDRVIPLPLILSQAAVRAAESQQQQNKQAALTLLETARNELNRSRALGYLSDAPEYQALDKQISHLESAIKGKSDTSSLFSELRDKLSAFVKRQKDHQRR